MEVKAFDIKGPIEIIPKIYWDHRGYFLESFNKHVFWEYGIPTDYVQDNQSYSRSGIIRGLHYQESPYGQDKLVRVISGRALDVVVDLRKDSPTYGEHLKVYLDGALHNMLFIPKGFAHGFAALTECVFSYKCSEYYHQEAESGIRWNDPTLGIDWEIDSPIVSGKDDQLPLFKSKAVL